MCNQGGYKYHFDETSDKTQLIFVLEVPKFMDTDSLNIDLQPSYIRCDIKGKITQLVFPEEIFCDKAKIERSTTTGYLQITAPKSDIDEIKAKQMRIAKMVQDREAEKKLKDLKDKEDAAKKQKFEDMGLYREYLEVGGAPKRPESPVREKFECDFDEDDVPPLE